MPLEYQFFFVGLAFGFWACAIIYQTVKPMKQVLGKVPYMEGPYLIGKAAAMAGLSIALNPYSPQTDINSAANFTNGFRSVPTVTPATGLEALVEENEVVE